jgi:hypothetical protein
VLTFSLNLLQYPRVASLGARCVAAYCSSLPTAAEGAHLASLFAPQLRALAVAATTTAAAGEGVDEETATEAESLMPQPASVEVRCACLEAVVDLALLFGPSAILLDTTTPQTDMLAMITSMLAPAPILCLGMPPAEADALLAALPADAVPVGVTTASQLQQALPLPLQSAALRALCKLLLSGQAPPPNRRDTTGAALAALFVAHFALLWRAYAGVTPMVSTRMSVQ